MDTYVAMTYYHFLSKNSFLVDKNGKIDRGGWGEYPWWYQYLK